MVTEVVHQTLEQILHNMATKAARVYRLSCFDREDWYQIGCLTHLLIQEQYPNKSEEEIQKLAIVSFRNSIINRIKETLLIKRNKGQRPLSLEDVKNCGNDPTEKIVNKIAWEDFSQSLPGRERTLFNLLREPSEKVSAIALKHRYRGRTKKNDKIKPYNRHIAEVMNLSPAGITNCFHSLRGKVAEFLRSCQEECHDEKGGIMAMATQVVTKTVPPEKGKESAPNCYGQFDPEDKTCTETCDLGKPHMKFISCVDYQGLQSKKAKQPQGGVKTMATATKEPPKATAQKQEKEPKVRVRHPLPQDKVDARLAIAEPICKVIEEAIGEPLARVVTKTTVNLRKGKRFYFGVRVKGTPGIVIGRSLGDVEVPEDLKPYLIQDGQKGKTWLFTGMKKDLITLAVKTFEEVKKRTGTGLGGGRTEKLVSYELE